MKTNDIVIEYNIHEELVAKAVKDNAFNILLLTIPAFTALGLAIGIYAMQYNLEAKLNELKRLKEQIVQERIQLHEEYTELRKNR